MDMKFYLFFIAVSCAWNRAESRKVVWTLPLDQARVIYHHQKICLNVKGVENCIKKDKEPGDPAELAKMFSIVHEYESDADGGEDREYDEPEEMQDDGDGAGGIEDELENHEDMEGHDGPIGMEDPDDELMLDQGEADQPMEDEEEEGGAKRTGKVKKLKVKKAKKVKDSSK